MDADRIVAGRDSVERLFIAVQSRLEQPEKRIGW
jgi:hypothetical protein